MRLYQVQDLLNKICSGVYQFDLRGVKYKAAVTAAGKLRENPTYSKPIGVWVQNLLDPNNKTTAVSPAAIDTWFKDGGRFTASLKANWKTASDLILDIASAAKEWNDVQKKNISSVRNEIRKPLRPSLKRTKPRPRSTSSTETGTRSMKKLASRTSTFCTRTCDRIP